MKYFILVTIFFLFQFQLGIAQVSQNNKADSTIIIRSAPEGSFLDSTLVTYVGVWDVGFEKNNFFPCGNWVPDSLGGSPVFVNSIAFSRTNKKQLWEFAKKAKDSLKAFILDRPKNATSDLFIKGKGWLKGPSGFGHFGSALFTIKSISYKEIRWAMPNECKS